MKRTSPVRLPGEASGPMSSPDMASTWNDRQPKSTTANANQRVRFDGSASYDAEDAPSGLTYAWDFEGDGTFDATGGSVAHKYAAAGTYPATLRVTDSGGKTGTAVVAITVR